MTIAVLLLVGGLLPLVIVLAARAVEMQAWRRSLVAFRLQLPRELTVDDAVRWLSALAAATHPPRWSLLPLPPVALEVVADHAGISHYVLVTPATRDMLLSTVRAQLPGARLDAVPPSISALETPLLADELTLTSHVRPLAVERAEAVSTDVLATLQPLAADERVVIQLMLTSAGTPPAATSDPATRHLAVPWWLERDVPADADAIHAQRTKQREPLLATTLRIGVSAATRERANALGERAWSLMQGLNAPGVQVVRRLLPAAIVAAWLRSRRYPLLRWPLLLNVREAVGLVAFPFATALPGLAPSQARQLPPLPMVPTTGNVVGRCNYPGLTDRPLALAPRDRLRHVHLIGPTGSGKSTLLAHMILQDIAAGHGVVVIDPKGDLVSDIAARIPPARNPDVVVLDPSAVQGAIVGFNPLRAALDDEASRELMADHVLNVFHSLYADFWGPRTDEILRAALFSLTHTRAPDGAVFTLMEVPELLTNPALRRYVSQHPDLPPAVRSFWQWFDGTLSAGDRVQAIGPVLNKLRAFSMRSSIRLLLGQSQGVTLSHRFSRRGVLLISLAKGKISSEAANLLGSLFVATMWQTTQARIALPARHRHPVFAYLDEFQDVVRLGANDSLADMLAQARGLGLSLTLAHQYLNQLPSTVRDATLGTVRTHVAFQLEWDDARTLADRFAPLTRDDLASLNAFEFALKPCVEGQTLPPVTGTTVPLGPPLQDAADLAAASRERYGLARSAIEAGLRARVTVDGAAASSRFGREGTGGRT